MKDISNPTDQILEELAGEAAQQVAELWCRYARNPLDAEQLEEITTGIWECFHAAAAQVPEGEAASGSKQALVLCT